MEERILYNTTHFLIIWCAVSHTFRLLASPRPPDNIKPGIHFISIVTMYCILNFSNLSIKELNFSVINILERCFFSNKEVILFMLTAKKHPTSTYWVSYHNNQHFRFYSLQEVFSIFHHLHHPVLA